MFIKTKFRCLISFRGFEIITEEFTKDGLAVPTFKEEFGGVTAIIKREIFQAIQLGSRGNSKQDDPKNDPNSDPNNLTERQLLIIGILENQGQPDDSNNEPETRSSIAKKLGISESTVKRESLPYPGEIFL